MNKFLNTMSKLLLDTMIYIDFINAEKYQEWVYVKDYTTRIYLSGIVLLELYIGARTQGEIHKIDNLQRSFEKRKRIVLPADRDYILAGQILAQLQRTKGYDLKKCYWLQNDVLIALTARRIGATVVTANRRDYEEIRAIRDFSLQVVS